MSVKQPAVPADIWKERDVWNRAANSHRVIYVVLGLAGVLCPLVVAAFVHDLPTWLVRVLSLIGSASVGIFAAFDVGNLTTRWREAWKHLNVACLKFEARLIDMDDLLKAYDEGLTTIGQMKSDLFAKRQEKSVQSSNQKQGPDGGAQGGKPEAAAHESTSSGEAGTTQP